MNDMKAPLLEGGQGSANRLVAFYLVVGLSSMLAMCWLTPPFQVPDEQQHFYRSYQISRLELRPEVRGGQAGAVLPDSLPALVMQSLGSLEPHRHRTVPRVPFTQTVADLAQPLNADEAHFVPFTGAALYAPLAYTPQALAIAIGRHAGWGPLGMLCAARCANALAAIALTAWALSLLSAGRLAGLVIALLPMTQFMTASVSPDALTIAGGFLVAALLQSLLDDQQWGWRRRIGWLGAALLLCAVKVVYLPVLAVGAISLWTRCIMPAASVRKAFFWQAATAVATTALIAAWFLYRAGAETGGESVPVGVNATEQLAYLRDNPLMPAMVVLRALYLGGFHLLATTSGLLGWLNVSLPPVLHALAAAALVISLLQPASNTKPGWLASGYVLALVFASFVLIELALYVAWTPVGAPMAQGVQGRYLTPLLPLAVLAIAWRMPTRQRDSVSRRLALLVPLLLVLLSAGTLVAIVTAYQRF